MQGKRSIIGFLKNHTRFSLGISILCYALTSLPLTALDGYAMRPDQCTLQLKQESYDKKGAPKDPLEPINRFFFQVNQGFDTMILTPAAHIYRATMPRPIRTGIHNVLVNIETPLYGLNFALQGAGKTASRSLVRFIINSTFGILGIFDVAAEIGLHDNPTSLGKTLAQWGAPSGPYIVLPLIGSSDPRDILGRGLSTAADPFNRWAIHEGRWTTRYIRTGIETLDTRERYLEPLEKIAKTEKDLYSALRDIYFQQRDGHKKKASRRQEWGE